MASYDPAEVAKFGVLRELWWDVDSKHGTGPLHAMNGPRVQFIREHVAGLLRRPPTSAKPFKGLKAIDVGCGGGLLSESLARLGAEVKGIDASAENVQIAHQHARYDPETAGIEFQAVMAEEVASSGERFDVVCGLEVVEHVPDPAAFTKTLCALAKPDGVVFMSTINRSVAGRAVAVWGGEYLTGMVPLGTHDADKFVRPDEIEGWVRECGFRVDAATGIHFNPLSGTWHLAPGMHANYILAATPQARSAPGT